MNTCEHCGGQPKTAASPIEGELPPAEGDGGGVSVEEFAALSARVDALEGALMASEMAALASADVSVPSY